MKQLRYAALFTAILAMTLFTIAPVRPALASDPPKMQADALLNLILEGKPVVLDGYVIEGFVDFATFFKGKPTISSSINIKNSEFKDGLNAKNIVFQQPIFFGNNKFFGPAVGFIDATFENNAIFSGAEFYAPVDFSGARFLMEANFSKTHFINDAEFNKSIFNGLVTFNSAKFDDPARFNGSHFCAEDPSSTTCAKYSVDFGYSVFKGAASFAESNFSRRTSEISYKSATFEKPVSFDKATFSKVSLAGTQFQSSASFRSAKFQEASFNHCSFKQLDITDAEFAVHVDLTGASYDSLKTFTFDFSKLNRADESQDGASVRQQLNDYRDVLLRLEENFRAKGQLVLSQRALYERRQVERTLNADQLSFTEQLQDTFEKAMGDYVRLDIPLMISGIILLISFLIYLLSRLLNITEVRVVPANAMSANNLPLLIRLITLKIPVTLERPPPKAVENAGSRSKVHITETTTLDKATVPNPDGMGWIAFMTFINYLKFTFRVFNDALGGNVELVCHGWGWYCIISLLVYLNRLLGICFVAGLTITLTNVVPAVKTLFG